MGYRNNWAGHEWPADQAKLTVRSISSKSRFPIEYWPLATGLLLTSLVVWFARRDLDWRIVLASLGKADLRYVALAVAAVLLNIALKAWRWQWLFHPESGQLHCRDLLSALMIGQLGNLLLPMRLGDAARIGVVHSKGSMTLSWALMTVVAEKALDSVMLLVLLGGLLPAVAWPAWLETTQLISGIVLAGGVVVVMCVATREHARRRVVQALQRLRPGLIAQWTERALQSLDAWRAVHDRQVQFRLWASSIAIWLLAGLVNHFVFRAVSLELPLHAGLLLAATEIAGTRLAYTPAGIGVYHSIAILTLVPFGVGSADAFSASVLLHLVVYLPIVIGGLAAVWSEGLTLFAPVAG